MTSLMDARAGAPCLERRCGHASGDHVATPELAGPTEIVVWCTKCLRHETRRPVRWSAVFGRSEGRRARSRLGRAS